MMRILTNSDIPAHDYRDKYLTIRTKKVKVSYSMKQQVNMYCTLSEITTANVHNVEKWNLSQVAECSNAIHSGSTSQIFNMASKQCR